MKEVVVSKEFRDINDFSKIYKIGSVVSMNDERAEELVSRGLVEGNKDTEEKAKAESKSKKDAEEKAKA